MNHIVKEIEPNWFHPIFNKNIDYIISDKKLPGVPEKAEILQLGVGKSFISRYKQKYNLT